MFWSGKKDIRALATIGALMMCLRPYPVQAQKNTSMVTAPVESAATDRPTNRPVAAAPDARYVIGADDVLAVDVWKEKEVSRVLPVRPDGKISLPLIGDLQASGLTPQQLQASVTVKLRAYIDKPEVSVIVQEARSHRFNVVGEVQKPGSYTLGQPLTVLDALALAGGFRDFAKAKKIYVLRVHPDGSNERIPFNYKQVIKGKKLAENIPLEPGDTVVVP